MDHGKRDVEATLFRHQVGTDVIDTLVQANVDLRTVSVEHVKQLLVETARRRTVRRREVAA